MMVSQATRQVFSAAGSSLIRYDLDARTMSQRACTLAGRKPRASRVAPVPAR